MKHFGCFIFNESVVISLGGLGESALLTGIACDPVSFLLLPKEKRLIFQQLQQENMQINAVSSAKLQKNLIQP